MHLPLKESITNVLKALLTMKNLSLIYCGLLSALFFLAGCKTDPAPSAPQVTYKRTTNEVFIRMATEPDRLNPVLSTGRASSTLYPMLFSQLAVYHPETLERIPFLAESLAKITAYESGDRQGLLGYTLRIRNAAKWDNGTPITAEDYVFTLKAIMNPAIGNNKFGPYLENIVDVVINPNDVNEFEVLTREKYILTEEVLTAEFPVLPRYAYDPNQLLSDIPLKSLLDAEKAAALLEKDDRLQTFAEAFAQPRYSREKEGIIGSGPYRFDSWLTGQQIIMNRKSDWWGDALAATNPIFKFLPERFVFQIVPDVATAVTMLKNEDLDVASKVIAAQFNELRQDSALQAYYTFQTPPLFGFYFVYLNTKNPKLADKTVRQALAHAVNVEEYINTSFEEYGERIVGPFHPSKSYYNRDLKPYEFDLARSKALLTSAGWTDTNGNGTIDKMIDGESVEFTLDMLVGAGIAPEEQLGLQIQNNLKKLGVQVNLISKASKERFVLLKERNYEIAAGALGGAPSSDDPKQVFHTTADTYNGFNRTGFGDATSDALIDSLRQELDPAKRQVLYYELQKILHDEQPMIFLLAPLERNIIHKRFIAEPTDLPPGYYLPWFELKK